MDAFLARFLTAVDDHLGDPVAAKRYPADKKLRDLRKCEVQIWEKLLRASGQQSTIGRCEATVTLRNGVSFYPLPGNFRQFLSLQRWRDGDRRQVLAALESISMFDPGPGVEILDASRGMMVRPQPFLDADQDWTLTYMKGPVPLHYCQASAVTATTLVSSAAVGVNAGELIQLPGFYNGCLLRVYAALTGAGQTREIANYEMLPGGPTFTLREAWDVTPTADVPNPIMYEICPALPEPYDEIYALDVAIQKCAPLGMMHQRAQLISDRAGLWDACRNYFGSNVADRMPRRSARTGWDEVDPYAQ